MVAEKENVRVLYLMFAFRAASTGKIKCASQIERDSLNGRMRSKKAEFQSNLDIFILWDSI